MKKQKKGLAIGLTMLALFVIFAAFATLALGPPTANSFGVDDAIGYKDTQVLIPVNITGVHDGPIPAIVFNVLYDNRVLNVVDVQKGTLTSDWKDPSYRNYDWGTRVALVYNATTNQPIQSGSSGSVVLLSCSVKGGYDDTSELKFSDIQLAEGGLRSQNYQVGSAPAKNCTFNVLLYGVINGWVTDEGNTSISGVTVSLTSGDAGVVPMITTTSKTGYYKFTNVEVGDYDMHFSKSRYSDYSTEMIVQSGETKEVNVTLPRGRR